jgi:hypothetical protein
MSTADPALGWHRLVKPPGLFVGNPANGFRPRVWDWDVDVVLDVDVGLDVILRNAAEERKPATPMQFILHCSDGIFDAHDMMGLLTN